MTRFKHRLAGATVLLATFLVAFPCVAQQQQLGHKIMGGLGLWAGAQPDAGLYVADRALLFHATELVNNAGASVPVGLDLNAFGNGFGVFTAIKLPVRGLYLNLAFAVPITSIRVSTHIPEASTDRFGLGDLYAQPLKLGWKLPRLDVVGGYAFYAPTGQYSPSISGDIGRGNWTHELCLGATVYFDRAKTWNLSVLSSYEMNSRKRGIDITRGNILQIQGGLAKTFIKMIDVGLAAYSEWQMTDDTGTALPPALLGLRERTFGLGPEIDVRIPKIRTLLTFRYMRDLIVRSRPKGEIFVVAVTVLAWDFQRDETSTAQ